MLSCGALESGLIGEWPNLGWTPIVDLECSSFFGLISLVSDSYGPREIHILSLLSIVILFGVDTLSILGDHILMDIIELWTSSLYLSCIFSSLIGFCLIFSVDVLPHKDFS